MLPTCWVDQDSADERSMYFAVYFVTVLLVMFIVSFGRRLSCFLNLEAQFFLRTFGFRFVFEVRVLSDSKGS